MDKSTSSIAFGSAVLRLGDPNLAADSEFAIARRPAPDGWERLISDDWVEYGPTELRLPSQGWKIHASACTESAEEILQAVWDYCVPRHIAFKFLRSQRPALPAQREVREPRGERQVRNDLSRRTRPNSARSSTNWARLSTAYPGPYILSDLRWGAGPLYARYGGFAERHCVGADGDARGGDRGRGRRAGARPARGDVLLAAVGHAAGLPRPHLAARNSAPVDDLPYRIERALHFSNGGGVYAGVKRETERASGAQGGAPLRWACTGRGGRRHAAGARARHARRCWRGSTYPRFTTTSRWPSTTSSSWSSSRGAPSARTSSTASRPPGATPTARPSRSTPSGRSTCTPPGAGRGGRSRARRRSSTTFTRATC